MEISFLDVLISVATLILLMIPAIILVKCKLLGEGADKALSNIVLYGAQPLMLLMGFQKRGYDPAFGLNMLIALGVAIVTYAITILIVFLIHREKSAKANVLRYASIFGNCGFMGIPFLQMLFQKDPIILGEVLVYCAIILTVWNSINWTLGIYIVSGNKKDISLKKVFLNPNIIAILLGIILFVTVQQPIANVAVQGSTLDRILEAFVGVCDTLANLVTPLGMFVIGLKISKVRFTRLLTDKYAYLASLTKLILVSVLSIIICILLPISSTLKAVLFFTSSMPAATSTALFATKFGGDADTASIVVLQTTVFSILTIPLMYLLYSNVVPYLSSLIHGIV